MRTVPAFPRPLRLLAIASVVLACWPAGAATAPAPRARNFSIDLDKSDRGTSVYAALETVAAVVRPQRPVGARLRVFDGRGQVYANLLVAASPPRFEVKGALGRHRIELWAGARKLASREFLVDARTGISTGAALDPHVAALTGQVLGSAQSRFIDGRSVRQHADSLRGHAIISNVARYFVSELTELPALFFRYQKDNGQVFASFERDTHFDPFTNSYPGVHLQRDLWGESFTGRSRDGLFVFERPPVEADTEALLVDHVYRIWQATGDDGLVRSWLPLAERAVGHVMSDPLRWSAEHGLVKRGFTIDWLGYQHNVAARLHPRGGHNRGGFFDGRWIDADTPMGIMHGDNAAMYLAATRLARLHAYFGDAEKAAHFTDVAERFRRNLEKTCWNGTFYRHFVRLSPWPEATDTGANESRQLSMSNALAINRDVTTHAQAISILKEYQRRREKTRSSSLAEWFTIDPAFQSGFEQAAPGERWNGSLSSLLAGELALAAFRHGQESYAADILTRVFALREKHGQLHAFYHPTPRQAGWQDETFTPIDLRAVANRHFRGDRPAGFIGHPENDLREFPVGPQKFLGKPFDVIDPRDNGGRSIVILWGSGSLGPRETAVSGIDRKATSIYFLHTAGNTRWGARVGEYIVQYRDGARVRIPLVVGANINSWWADGDAGAWKVAWRGKNPHASKVAMGVWGWNNKHAEKTIDSISVRAAQGERIQLAGITLSSAPVQWERGDVVPTGSGAWGAASVLGAVFEGLVGISDEHRLFDHVTVAPRWVSIGQADASATVRYPASDGYVSYRYRHDAEARVIRIDYSGSGRRFDFHVQLPPGGSVRRVTAAGHAVRHANAIVEDSPYADFTVDGAFAGPLEIRY